MPPAQEWSLACEPLGPQFPVVSTLGYVITAAIAIVVIRTVRGIKRLGQPTVSEERIAAGTPILRAHRDVDGARWDALGSATEARGLDLSFRADDDPGAEATMRVPDAPAKARSTTSLIKRVKLTRE
jgi:hypothetical protein